MERIFLVGEFSPKIKGYFKSFFERLGIFVIFTMNDPGKSRTAFFKSELRSFQAHNASLYGLAFPNENTALIRYPAQVEIKSSCLGLKGFTGPLRLFSLVALHEFLHLKGLDHCNSIGCLMARKSCKVNGTGGYCLSCLSLSKSNVPLCSKCREKAGVFIRL